MYAGDVARNGKRIKKSSLIGGRVLQLRVEREHTGMETRLTVTFPPYLYRRLLWPVTRSNLRNG